MRRRGAARLLITNSRSQPRGRHEARRRSDWHARGGHHDHARADTVTDWNQTAIEVMKTANVAGNPWSRTWPWCMSRWPTPSMRCRAGTRAMSPQCAGPDASAEAAAAAAARQILVQLYPNQKAIDREAYAASIKAIPEGGEERRHRAGRAGRRAVQADRAADGTSAPDTYRPLTTPGVWVPTTPPMFAQYAQAKPWVLKSADQFRPGPPPQLSSALYARDYNETKNLGGAKSTARTAEQTDAVKFWTQSQYRPRVAGGGAPTLGGEGAGPRRERTPVRAAQHGHRQHLHQRLGCEVHL